MILKYLISLTLLASMSCTDHVEKEESPNLRGAVFPPAKGMVHADPGLEQKGIQENLFKFESAYIEFSYVEGMTGNMEVYIGGFGKTIVTHNNMVRNGKDMAMVSIYKQGVLYKYAPGQETGTISKYEDLSPAEVMKHTFLEDALKGKSEARLSREGYERKADEVIARKVCEVYKSKYIDQTICRWQNLNLRERNFAMRSHGFERVATTFQEGLPIPAGRLELPPGRKID